jgi:hypothetical protein
MTPNVTELRHAGDHAGEVFTFEAACAHWMIGRGPADFQELDRPARALGDA